MTIDFRDLLSRPASDFPEAPLLATGLWKGVLLSDEFGRSDQKQTPFWQVTVRPTEPLEDVNPSEIEGLDLTQYEMEYIFYITPKALFMISKFQTSLGFDASMNLDDFIRDKDWRGMEVLFRVEHQEGTRVGLDGKKRKFARITAIQGLGNND